MSPRRAGDETEDLELWVDWLANHYTLDHRIIPVLGTALGTHRRILRPTHRLARRVRRRIPTATHPSPGTNASPPHDNDSQTE